MSYRHTGTPANPGVFYKEQNLEKRVTTGRPTDIHVGFLDLSSVDFTTVVDLLVHAQSTLDLSIIG